LSLTVIGGSVSPFVRKVRIVLSEKGLDYDLEQLNPFAPPADFREISPLGKIPAFRDGDRLLNDSSIICAYLERRFPQPALYPEDAFEYARALWLEEYVDGAVIPMAGPSIFFKLVLEPLMTGNEPDEAGPLRAVEEDLPPFLDYLERQVLEGQAGEDGYLVGDRLSIADIAVASPFVNLRHAGVAPDRARWPNLRAFIDRMHARPAFKALIDEETPIFGKRSTLITD
jgi:glutathione S-transferase